VRAKETTLQESAILKKSLNYSVKRSETDAFYKKLRNML